MELNVIATIFKQKGENKKKISTFYLAAAKSVLLHCADSLAINNHEMKKLESVH